MKRKHHYKIRDFSPLHFAIIFTAPVVLWLAMWGMCHLIIAISGII